MGGAAFPPCCLTWGQTMVEVMKIMDTSLKRSMCTLLHSVPRPCSRAPLTQASAGSSWTLMGKSGSVSCGVTAPFLLGPDAHKLLFLPSKCLFSQFCVSSGGSLVGLTATSSERAYAILRILHWACIKLDLGFTSFCFGCEELEMFLFFSFFRHYVICKWFPRENKAPAI